MLVRLLVAVAILSLVGLKILDGLAETRRLAACARETDAAVYLAQSEMEFLRAQESGSLRLGEEQPLHCGLPLPSEISRATGTVNIREATPGLLHVSVEVKWPRQDSERTVELESFIAISAEVREGPP